jgi:YrbI family 3-deoxy-D-manno-octulosonate 8-phosphate phosphatase
MELSIDDVDAFIFDFDGVLTNNLVYLNSDGNEWVCCSRADGLAFDVIHKLKKPVYILSTEKNAVVTARAKKLNAIALQGVVNKVVALFELAETNSYDLGKVLYVGNDLNDFKAMQLCGYTFCPADSHEEIKKIATTILKNVGGEGVAREILENVLKINFIEILYGE